MESTQWSGFLKESNRGSANGCRGVSSRGMHSDKCPSDKCVFLLARMDCNDNNDSGVCDRIKLF